MSSLHACVRTASVIVKLSEWQALAAKNRQEIRRAPLAAKNCQEIRPSK